jgi:TRAP-type C4-dicarboxylate transport system substrate-binding protein
MKTLMASVAAVALSASVSTAAMGQTTNLRFQTHYAPETVSGKLAAEYVDNVQTMSNGQIKIEIFYSSSVVKSVETFDAAATGILDCDMTGGAYQTGKNPAFQFVGDVMGGYDTPYQLMSWLYYGGGREAAQALYNKFDMELIGWWIYGQESLSSSKPIAGPADLKDFKFRSPPGLETKIFENLGAKPIVMDFTEIFTALETGIIDGADASGLANNVGLGLYDLVQHATYPGFHSMPMDHLACNKAKWDAMPEHHRRSPADHVGGDGIPGAAHGRSVREEERRSRRDAHGQGRQAVRLERRRPASVPQGRASRLGRFRIDAGSQGAGRQSSHLSASTRSRPITGEV